MNPPTANPVLPADAPREDPSTVEALPAVPPAANPSDAALSAAPTSRGRTPGTAASDASSRNVSIAPIGLSHASPSVVSIREEAEAPSFRRHFGQHVQPL
ncbi:hypothetical protein PF007_g2387 [Phytophthora fragariae]|uniref:Uncharacterized protein n=1 Tax=Phytophthora fragariae TaxID=53985 RepID=A0A6A3TS99_9STRA|nr:hypothetical protein PF007_g2387 [Phytophthora fragariae]